MEEMLTDRRPRLRLDYQVAMLMQSPIMKIEAYQSIVDLRSRQNAIRSIEEGHLATHYRVAYKIRTLVGRGEYSPKTIVRFDLFADNDYPQSQPACYVIDSPIPWSPHFDQVDPLNSICVGDEWLESHGDMLLGDLFVHIAKLLNFDEPEYKNPNYFGYNKDAVEYWIQTLGRRPLTNMSYPVVEDIVRELIKIEPVVHVASKSFKIKRAAPSPSRTIMRKPTSPAPIGPARRQITRRRLITT